MRLLRLAPLALALCSTVAAAQLYSWKDASGKVHYSDEPPPEKAAVRKVAPPAAGAGDASAQSKRAEQDAALRKKEKEAKEVAEKAAKDKAGADERRAECERARGNLQAHESGQVRFTVNSKGERVAMDDAMRASELANARKAVDSWCKQ